jgi:hypothetical protein
VTDRGTGMHEPQKMVAWYSPPRLVSTGIRVAISTVFGEFADRREIQSIGRQHETALDRGLRLFQAPDRPFWFDYVADCGDGWNSTYAIARLLAQEELRPRGCEEPLPRGTFLVMGGDMVYPTAIAEGLRQAPSPALRRRRACRRLAGRRRSRCLCRPREPRLVRRSLRLHRHLFDAPPARARARQ